MVQGIYLVAPAEGSPTRASIKIFSKIEIIH